MQVVMKLKVNLYQMVVFVHLQIALIMIILFQRLLLPIFLMENSGATGLPIPI